MYMLKVSYKGCEDSQYPIHVDDPRYIKPYNCCLLKISADSWEELLRKASDRFLLATSIEVVKDDVDRRWI